MEGKFSIGDAINYLVIFIFGFLCIFPFLYVFSISFTDPDVYIPLKFTVFPEKFSIRAYTWIIGTDSFINAMKSSVFVTVAGTILNLIVTFTAAYGLSRKEMPGNRLIMALITFTLVFSAGIVPNYILIKDLHMINSYSSIILPVLTNAWSLVVVRNFMLELPRELEEAARIDGCNDLQVFARVVLPLSGAVIATFTLFFAVAHWNSYFNTMIYITKSSKWTLPLLVKSMVVDSGAIGYAGGAGVGGDQKSVPQETIKMATIVLSMLPVIILYPFLQKYFVKGVLVGAVKG
ncbi:MAG: carbohydrate ABC transporter permease [Clostridiales bacterium]|jgi:putative aldouronate transport system permease protein|nr:carbohydrate ABC transporter permease [Clostridiales bacterium]